MLNVHSAPNMLRITKHSPETTTMYDYGTLRDDGNAYITERGSRYSKSCFKKLTLNEFLNVLKSKSPWSLHGRVTAAARNKAKELKDSEEARKESNKISEWMRTKENFLRGERVGSKHRSKLLGDYD